MKLFYIILFFSITGLAQTPQDLYKESINYFEQKKYDLAIKSVNKAINKSKSSVEDFFILKYKIHLKNKDFGLLKKTLDQALKHFPNSNILLLERMELCNLTNDFKQSEIDMIKLMQLNEKYRSQDNFLKLAGILFKKRSFNRSFEIVKSILKNDPTNFHALNLLGSILCEKKDYTKSLEIFNSILELDVENVSVNIGYVYQKINNNEKAMKYFEKSLSINKKNPFALSNLAKSKLAIGKIDEALELINKSIQILPNNPYAFRVRGNIYLKKHQKEKACFDFVVAKELGYDEQYQDSIFDVLPEECKALFFQSIKK